MTDANEYIGKHRDPSANPWEFTSEDFERLESERNQIAARFNADALDQYSLPDDKMSKQDRIEAARKSVFEAQESTSEDRTAEGLVIATLTAGIGEVGDHNTVTLAPRCDDANDVESLSNEVLPAKLTEEVTVTPYGLTAEELRRLANIGSRNYSANLPYDKKANY